MSWPTVRLGWVCRRIVDGTHASHERVLAGVPLLSAKNVADAGLTVTDEESLISEQDARDIRARGGFSTGDVLLTIVGTIGRTYRLKTGQEHAWQRSVASITPAQGLDGGFLNWALRSSPTQHALIHGAKQSAQAGIYLGDLADLPVPLPPLDVQRRIADFLDDQTVRIDALLDARHRQAELLGRRPWLAFDEALSRFRGSSCPLRRALVSVSDGPFGSAFSSSDYVFEGHPVVRLGNIGFAEFRWTSLAAVPNGIYERFPTAQVHSGDLLIASLGDEQNHAGRACVAPDGLKGALVKGKCFRAQVDRRHAEPQFLAVALSGPTGASVMSELSRGATRKMINIEILKGAVIPLPRVEEQRAMLADFGILRMQASELLDRIALASNLLYERKRSLITAAVTGEFDVSTASTRAADVALSGVGGGL